MLVIDGVTKQGYQTLVGVNPQTTQYGLDILVGLSLSSKHVYAGTVPAHVIAKRRRQGKVAKQSRKANR